MARGVSPVRRRKDRYLRTMIACHVFACSHESYGQCTPCCECLAWINWANREFIDR